MVETETLTIFVETRPRQDINTSRDHLETEMSRSRPQPCFIPILTNLVNASLASSQFLAAQRQAVLSLWHSRKLPWILHNLATTDLYPICLLPQNHLNGQLPVRCQPTTAVSLQTTTVHWDGAAQGHVWCHTSCWPKHGHIGCSNWLFSSIWCSRPHHCTEHSTEEIWCLTFSVV